MNYLKNLISEKKYDQLDVNVYSDRQTMGVAAADYVITKMQALMVLQERIRMIFAASVSQDNFLAALSGSEEIDWSRVTAFHMDEYIGLKKDDPQSFGNYLRKHLFDLVPIKDIHYIDPVAPDPEVECQRYADLIDEEPIDIICLGIGENGHIAFNDPPVADFIDLKSVKIVEMDEKCRQQQVNDGCFADISGVPKRAISITIPVFMQARSLSIVVPGERKAQAIYDTLNGKIDTRCPATVLRNHPDALLFLDQDSARKVIGL
jgi:glucosamine-6-phosphate deaminase